MRIFLAVLVAAMRETGAQRSLVPRAAVPRQTRVNFDRALPCLIALWALGGFYLSLRPALAADLAASSSPLWGGTVIFLLTGSAAAAAILGRHSSGRPAMLYGLRPASPQSVSPREPVVTDREQLRRTITEPQGVACAWVRWWVAALAARQLGRGGVATYAG